MERILAFLILCGFWSFLETYGSFVPSPPLPMERATKICSREEEKERKKERSKEKKKKTKKTEGSLWSTNYYDSEFTKGKQWGQAVSTRIDSPAHSPAPPPRKGLSGSSGDGHALPDGAPLTPARLFPQSPQVLLFLCLLDSSQSLLGITKFPGFF